LERAIMRTWNRHYWGSGKKVPPEEFFLGEVGAAFKVDTLNNIIIFVDAFDSTPEVPVLKSVLWAEGFNSSLEVSALLNGKGLPDSVEELEFGGEVDDVHWFQIYRLVYFLW
jgi:hypothetical protein